MYKQYPPLFSFLGFFFLNPKIQHFKLISLLSIATRSLGPRECPFLPPLKQGKHYSSKENPQLQSK